MKEILYSMFGDEVPELDTLLGKAAILTSENIRWIGEIKRLPNGKYGVLSERSQNMDSKNERSYKERFFAHICTGDIVECNGIEYKMNSKTDAVLARADELIKRYSEQ